MVRTIFSRKGSFPSALIQSELIQLPNPKLILTPQTPAPHAVSPRQPNENT